MGKTTSFGTFYRIRFSPRLIEANTNPKALRLQRLAQISASWKPLLLNKLPMVAEKIVDKRSLLL
jgi:hypothetical protein